MAFLLPPVRHDALRLQEQAKFQQRTVSGLKSCFTVRRDVSVQHPEVSNTSQFETKDNSVFNLGMKMGHVGDARDMMRMTLE